MAETHSERREVNARIVYWGVDGAGKSTNLRCIHAKLRPDHRGALREVPTPLDPTRTYEVLPIKLGELGGVRTRIQITAVPGAPEQTPTRKQLLDGVDGIVFVVDSSRGRIDENIASLEELRRSLAAYGRSLEDIPLVIQHNKEDQADPYALEELHRKLAVQGAAVFVAVAREGAGVLQTLTTISKRVIRTLRDAPRQRPPRAEAAPPIRAAATPEPLRPEPADSLTAPIRSSEGRDESQARSLEEAALTAPEHADEAETTAGRTQSLLQPSWEEITEAGDVSPGDVVLGDDWNIRAVGRATLAGPRSVRVPAVLSDGEGRELRLHLTLSLDPVDAEGSD